ncbi:low molecular weight phosphatase family protein [Acrocarpospora pleiomorpha]|uniref:Low molecular weight phosphatase family protein n=1 Tax=Acrocarpospora pleiomorpha TaxID=90975 RepID=A0A5M3XCF5_9ACTN|nr:arsenate reductase ArsC [Acrocarpospora pleiomorpha]GES18452.1 low molecular weight phosphatase family protein [Acrocarpospora pleiomorpha]
MTTPPQLSSNQQLNQIIDQLLVQFAGRFGAETIRRHVHESYLALHREATVMTHLYVLTQRFVTERLTALAQVNGYIPKVEVEVLYVCGGNAGRSQMAAALTRKYGGDWLHVRTAGTRPAAGIHPPVVTALAEVGLLPAMEFPKPLTDEFVQAADVVVTMGCGDACAIHPGRRYLDWELEDPCGQSLAGVRRIRDAIDERVRLLVAELQQPVPL